MYDKRDLQLLIQGVAEKLAKDMALRMVAAGQDPSTTEAELRILAGESKGLVRFKQELDLAITYREDTDD